MANLSHLTEEQREIVDSASAALSADGQVEALWLAGSLGRRAGDEYSDVDLLVLVRGAAASAVGERYAEGVGHIAKTVLVNPLYGSRIINIVTDDWRRFDLSFIEAGDLDRYNASHLIELFNKGGREPPIKIEQPYRPRPDAVIALVNEFLRVLGLSAVAVGRREWVLAQWGATILRQLTMDLMLEENAVSPVERGGALRRRPLLTPAQMSELESLTPVAANREAVLISPKELASLFLPRARALANDLGAGWPAEFEAATKRRLRASLGLEIE